MNNKWLTFICAVYLFITYFSTPLLSAEKDGWYVRIDPATTEANAIDFWVGKAGEKYSQQYWTRWDNSSDTELDLPEYFRNNDMIWIKAVSIPENKQVRMFVIYKDETPQEMTFSGEQDQNFKKEFFDSE